MTSSCGHSGEMVKDEVGKPDIGHRRDRFLAKNNMGLRYCLTVALALLYLNLFPTLSFEEHEDGRSNREKRQFAFPGFHPQGQQPGVNIFNPLGFPNNQGGFNPFGQPQTSPVGGNQGQPVPLHGVNPNLCRGNNRNRPECQQGFRPQGGQFPPQGGFFGQQGGQQGGFFNRPGFQQGGFFGQPSGQQGGFFGQQGGFNQQGLSQAFQQLPWLNFLTTDNQTLSLPGLPETPTSQASSRFFQLASGEPDVPFQKCVTPKLESGHCRYLQHCILPEFANSFNAFLSYVCFIKGVYVGACCPDYRYPELQTTVTPPPPPPPPSTPRPPNPDNQGCGRRANDGTRIVGGKNADPREYPWMAALLRDGSRHYCGGVLISGLHVLTAAHCVDGFNANSITVRLGEYDFDSQKSSPRNDIGVRQILQHGGYDRETYVNDIAILLLAQDTSSIQDIWPICLPPQDTGDLAGSYGVITGWGTIYFGGPVSKTLQEVRVPVWTNAECDAAYEQKIVEDQLCAGEKQGGKDSCQGDSGGPFQMKLGPQNRWTVVGVVSWGIRCAEPGYPGVYTRVSRYLNWISQSTGI